MGHVPRLGGSGAILGVVAPRALGAKFLCIWRVVFSGGMMPQITRIWRVNLPPHCGGRIGAMRHLVLAGMVLIAHLALAGTYEEEAAKYPLRASVLAASSDSVTRGAAATCNSQDGENTNCAVSQTDIPRATLALRIPGDRMEYTVRCTPPSVPGAVALFMHNNCKMLMPDTYPARKRGDSFELLYRDSSNSKKFHHQRYWIVGITPAHPSAP